MAPQGLRLPMNRPAARNGFARGNLARMRGESPYANLLCWEREVSQRQLAHKRKLLGIRRAGGEVDNKTPSVFHQQRGNAKREHLERTKRAEVDFANTVLMQHMAKAMEPDVASPSRQFSPGLRLSQHQTPIIDHFPGRSNPHSETRTSNTAPPRRWLLVCPR